MVETKLNRLNKWWKPSLINVMNGENQAYINGDNQADRTSYLVL